MSWIEIPNWDRFQHYGLYRRPAWIKTYTSLLHKDEYLDLPLAARGLLHGIWLAYADSNGRLRVSDVPAYCHGRARGAHIDALNHAGFIAFRASTPLNLDLKTRTLSDPRAIASGVPGTGNSVDDLDPAVLVERIKGWLETER